MKIAVFCPNWVGDAVMATPAIRAVRQHFAGARVTGVFRPYVASVFEGSPWFDDHVLLGTTGSWRQRWPLAAAALRQKGIDLAVLFPNSFRTALVARLGGCRQRVGYNRYGRSFLLSQSLEPTRTPDGKLVPSPAIDAYNRLAEAVGCPPPGYKMKLFTTWHDDQGADTIWQNADCARYPEVIGLNPGAAFGAAKHWPSEYFADLAQLLVDHRGSAVLVLCGPAEREQAQRIVFQSRRPGVFSLADQPLSIGLTKACIRRLDLLITTDSGPRHIATAFNRPVVTLFGPTHIAWTETYHAKAIHLQKKVDCGPCQLRVCPLDHRCMKLLSPREVFHAAVDLLARCANLPAAG